MVFIYSVLFYFSLHYIETIASIACGMPANDNVIQSKITGGTDTTQRDWPWNVQLGYEVNPREYHVFCGGAVLNNEWLVTAAHCLYDTDSKRLKDLSFAYAILGDRGVPKGSIIRYLPRQKIRVHESFNGVGKNDIALIHLDKPVRYTEYIRPVCLSEYEQDFVGKDATVTGWGKLSPDGNGKPTRLQAAQVKIFSGWECATKYVVKMCIWCAFVMFEDTICAGRREGGADSCQGDSGSPLVVQGVDGSWTLVGVVSGGVDCGKEWTPSLYTYVPKYTKWIRNMMWTHTY